MRTILVSTAIIFTLTAALAMVTEPGSPRARDFPVSPPDEVFGWRPDGPDAFYDSENLYEYIDGGAEVYRAFNVRTVLARRYVKSGAPDIIADIFDMGSSADAFGAYHHDIREGTDTGIGQDCEFMGGALYFWKGQYFVSIIAFDETEETRQAVLELGRQIAEAIPEAGARPDLLKYVPYRNRLSKEVHYFHDHQILNKYYFLADENLLRLNSETEAILVRYKPEMKEGKSSQVTFVLIRYPSHVKARKAHANFLRRYFRGPGEVGMAKTENGKWSGAKLHGRLLAVVFDAPSKQEIERLIREMEKLYAE